MDQRRTPGRAKGLWTLNNGSITFDAGLVVVGASGEVVSPIVSYLVEHDRGLVLFDTGPDPDAADRATEVYGDLARGYNMAFTAENRVDRQIELVGFDPADVTHVVVSHSHWDHSGGVKLFPDANIYIGGEDLRYVFWPDPAGRDVFRWQDFEAARAYNWFPLDGDLDLFGDGSVVVLAMPGHTPGNGSLLVRLEQETVILTADTVHLRKGLHDILPMGGDHDTRSAVASIQRLRQLQASESATVMIGHDPEDLASHGGYGRYRGRPIAAPETTKVF